MQVLLIDEGHKAKSLVYNVLNFFYVSAICMETSSLFIGESLPFFNYEGVSDNDDF